MSSIGSYRAADRRQFLLGTGAAALFTAFLRDGASAQEAQAQWQLVLKSIYGDAKPIEGKILTVDIPEIAENGNTVPFTIAVESPMTEAEYVKAAHIVSTGNPQADVASFTFTPESGKAIVSSRMRLAKSQDVVAVAELSDGRFMMAKKSVKVTIGGCGG